MTAALRADALGKTFGGTTALRDVSFELQPGEIHALCGENGAGKSTLIKILSGVHPAGSYTGRFEVEGREARFPAHRDARRAGIGVIYQELALVDELTVAENLFLGEEPRRWGLLIDRASCMAKATALIARFGVPLDPTAPVHGLGVAQKQLVEILKALARDSRILILDEPTAALAPHEVQSLLATLVELRARGIALIYISHRLEEVLQIADRITVLRDGATVATMAREGATEAELVRHMVGRDIVDLYARREGKVGAPVLEVRGLDVADERGRPRLRGIGFTLHAGEVLGIGGLMGAGRSELLMHLFGAWGRRTQGEVRLAGMPYAPRDPKAALACGVALLTEDRRRYGLHLDETIGFNLSLSSLSSLATAGIVRSGAERLQNMHWYDTLDIRAAGLAAVAGRLSGGNQQKVVLGKALMTRPRVILLDEPSRGIDIGAKAEIYARINMLTARGCAVLLVSGDLPELLGLSDRILMLRAGTVAGTHAGRDATAQTLLQTALGH